jgi:hypothetical protein
MRLVPALILLAAGSAICVAPAEAKTRHHRSHARHAAHTPPRQPAHGMSPLARAQARERDQRQLQQLAEADGGRPKLRMGTFKRDYSLNVYRPTIRPDQDGAVGLSLHMKTHD